MLFHSYFHRFKCPWYPSCLGVCTSGKHTQRKTWLLRHNTLLNWTGAVSHRCLTLSYTRSGFILRNQAHKLRDNPSLKPTGRTGKKNMKKNKNFVFRTKKSCLRWFFLLTPRNLYLKPVVYEKKEEKMQDFVFHTKINPAFGMISCCVLNQGVLLTPLPNAFSGFGVHKTYAAHSNNSLYTISSEWDDFHYARFCLTTA